ncbi:MAG: hypothetical protein U1F83_05575 [Verrucomicrobiota bacterium]
MKSFHQRAVQRAKEAWHALHIKDVNQVLDRAMRIVGAERLIGHLRQRGLVGRSLKHPIQFRLLALFGEASVVPWRAPASGGPEKAPAAAGGRGDRASA